jgi:hypothetical protein
MVLAWLDVHRLPTPRDGIGQVARLHALEETRLGALGRIFLDRDFGRDGRDGHRQQCGGEDNPAECVHGYLLLKSRLCHSCITFRHNDREKLRNSHPKHEDTKIFSAHLMSSSFIFGKRSAQMH